MIFNLNRQNVKLFCNSFIHRRPIRLRLQIRIYVRLYIEINLQYLVTCCRVVCTFIFMIHEISEPAGWQANANGPLVLSMTLLGEDVTRAVLHVDAEVGYRVDVVLSSAVVKGL